MTLEKDILLIAKGYFSINDSHKDTLEAFNAYYHKEYGCEEINMDYGFCINLFLKPTIVELSELSPRYFANSLLTPSVCESNEYSMDKNIYLRLLSTLICFASGNLVDLKDYFEWDEESQSDVIKDII